MRTGLVAALALAAGAGVGCGAGSYGSGSAAPAPAPACTAASATAVTGAIEIVGMEFVPSCAKLPAGTAVTFTNDDSVAHTVTSDPGNLETFDSGSLAPGAKFAHTFAAAGTEHLHCTIHPSMHVTVIVQ